MREKKALFSRSAKYVAWQDDSGIYVAPARPDGIWAKVVDRPDGSIVAVSDMGKVALSSPDGELVVVLSEGRRKTLRLPHGYVSGPLSGCFANESDVPSPLPSDVFAFSWKDGEVFLYAICDTIDCRSSLVCIEDSVWYRDRHIWLGGCIGLGDSVIAVANYFDVGILVANVVLYICSLPYIVKKLVVGKTWIAALCDTGAVYVIPMKFSSEPVKIEAKNVADIAATPDGYLACVCLSPLLVSWYGPFNYPTAPWVARSLDKLTVISQEDENGRGKEE